MNGASYECLAFYAKFAQEMDSVSDYGLDEATEVDNLPPWLAKYVASEKRSEIAAKVHGTLNAAAEQAKALTGAVHGHIVDALNGRANFQARRRTARSNPWEFETAIYPSGAGNWDRTVLWTGCSIETHAYQGSTETLVMASWLATSKSCPRDSAAMIRDVLLKHGYPGDGLLLGSEFVEHWSDRTLILSALRLDCPSVFSEYRLDGATICCYLSEPLKNISRDAIRNVYKAILS